MQYQCWKSCKLHKLHCFFQTEAQLSLILELKIGFYEPKLHLCTKIATHSRTSITGGGRVNLAESQAHSSRELILNHCKSCHSSFCQPTVSFITNSCLSLDCSYAYYLHYRAAATLAKKTPNVISGSEDRQPTGKFTRGRKRANILKNKKKATKMSTIVRKRIVEGRS